MNEIINIINQRNLYVYIILFKIYISTEGRTNEGYSGNLDSDIKKLMGEGFNLDDYYTAIQYLVSEGLLDEDEIMTTYGRSHIENWAKEFSEISNHNKELLQKNLEHKVFDFFGFTKKANTVLSFINNIVNTFEK